MMPIANPMVIGVFVPATSCISGAACAIAVVPTEVPSRKTVHSTQNCQVENICPALATGAWRSSAGGFQPAGFHPGGGS